MAESNESAPGPTQKPKPDTHYRDKIDPEGNYRPFYGYTAVCMVSDRKGRPLQWEELLKRAPNLRAHVSPLPASSYHVTLYDIFTQREVPERYAPRSGQVPSLHWSRAHETLWEDMKLAQIQCDRFQGDVHFMKKKFKLGGHVGSSVVIEGTLSNPGEVSAAEDNLIQVFGEIGKPVAVHHITLGYVYKSFNENELEKILEELRELWPLIENTILLDKPSVYYFETMEEFLPAKGPKS